MMLSEQIVDDRAVKGRPVVLLDCDGVVVDNIEFERNVTSLIIAELCDERGIGARAAEEVWALELAQTKGDLLWYDYSYHCDRLGLNGKQVAEASHLRSAHLLKPVPGASDTLNLLRDQGVSVGIVTDATSWVVEFKLQSLALMDRFLFTFSSDAAWATKANSEYWKRLAETYSTLDYLALVDNRLENLRSAEEALPSAKSFVQFQKNEHVTTLSDKIAPIDRGLRPAQTTFLVSTHKELQSLFRGNLPHFV